MKMRELGRTGIRVGEIGCGCEGFVNKSPDEVRAFLDAMERSGANCIDLYSPNPEMRSALGAALKGRREKFVLQGHLCSIWEEGPGGESQYKRSREIGPAREAMEDQLRRLGTDYLDIGMIHYVDSMADWKAVLEGPVMEYALTMMRKGIFRYIGLSSHNPEVALAAVESGLIGALMFSVNPCYDLQPGDEDLEKLWAPESYEKPLLNMDPAREALYETCQRNGVGITVMKVFGGGDLLSSGTSPAGAALTPYQCIGYALDRPGVASVLVGARTVEELEKSLAFETATESETDYVGALSAFPKISWEGHCMYCGHCAPCPVGIDVAAVTKFLNLAKAQGEIPETVREHYAALPHKGGECIDCRACVGRCPFGVPAAENMAEAARVFGK